MIQERDRYFKKVVELRHAGETLSFRVAQDLFSSHRVDVGTQRLLRSLAREGFEACRKVLDLGCGYGPLGLALKKEDPGRSVHLVDRDALAVTYTRQNAVLNAIPEVEVYAGLGYDDVRVADFDLVISNIPGKAGDSVITYLLRDAYWVLKPGGYVAVVVVAPLASLVARTLDAIEAEVLFHEERSGHAIFHYSFSHEVSLPPQPHSNAVDRGIYDRQVLNLALDDVDLTLHTAWGLPEFDSLSYRTDLVLEVLMAWGGAIPERVLLFNPGQGHLPTVLWRLMKPAHISLVDRDLLALRYSRRNLVNNGCPIDRVELCHQVGLARDVKKEIQLAVGLLREEEGREAIAASVRDLVPQLEPGGTVLLAGGSTPVTRLIDDLRDVNGLRVRDRRKRRGRSLLELERR